ncbi:MAG: DUF1415 domain-containing protein [Pseudomonadota bacterium]|nr:DUF1415 domain-containing protein [Pseudomonadota bacterium]
MNGIIEDSCIIEASRRWVETAVIGLGLCPFAASVYRSGRVRFVVSVQRSAVALVEELREELLHLQRTAPAECETTLLIHPWVLTDFIEFNEFLQTCEDTVRELGLEGDLQVASFHPQYQFAGTLPADIENFTNRSPYPMLHILREASVEVALRGLADPAAIYRENIAKMRVLGAAGWEALWAIAPLSPKCGRAQHRHRGVDDDNDDQPP